MRAVVTGLAAAVLVVASGGLAAGRDDEKVDAKLLIGKWTPEEKKDKQVVIEFAKGGKLSITAGEDFKIDGTYKLEGNKLTITMKKGEEEKTKARTIHSLTKEKLVSTGENGKKDTLIRVGGGKKE
jgi:uncharacterized protein (TIGR03066 family)